MNMDIKSFVLIEEGDRYLLIKEATFKWKGKWFLPGGGVKKGERPELAVLRETKEEAGVDVELTGIFYVKCYQGALQSKLHIYYTGRVIGGEPKRKANRHSLEAAWFTYEQIRHLPVRQKLWKIIEKRRKTQVVLPVKNFKLILFKSMLKRLGKAIGV